MDERYFDVSPSFGCRPRSQRQYVPTPYENPYPVGMAGNDIWVSVQHGDQFPKDAVRAMDRELNNSDPITKNCYVAFWEKNGESVFGRALNNNGKVEAWFPYGDEDIHSGIATTFSVLIDPSQSKQKFRYDWIPIAQLKSANCQPVRQKECSPVVIRDLQLDSFSGELLGKVNLERQTAWVGHSGKIYRFTDKQFENAYVMCRVPNYAQWDSLAGEDVWLNVCHGESFPIGAVRAMDRELNNSGQETMNCYVAMWIKENQAIFGRAWNNSGKIEAYFSHNGKEVSSADIKTFGILIYVGPPKQNFCYAWIPVQQLNSMLCQPVCREVHIPVVIPDLQLGIFRGELLGNGHLGQRSASVSFGGNEYCLTEKQFEIASALCRVPNFSSFKPVGMVGDSEWIGVEHGGPFPDGAIQAMGRQLVNNDEKAKICYVALWHKCGEPVFGRAWNNDGKVEAWFPWGGDEYHSADIRAFCILIYSGPPKQNYRYEWIPINQLNSNCQPVRKDKYSPVVIPDLKIVSFQGELLGKVNLERQMAWVSVAGKEYYFTDKNFQTSFVLCRMPL